MLHIGICDDERQARFVLRCALERKLEPHGLEAEIFEFSSGDGLLHWQQKNAGRLDLVFLDIEMPGPGGMETAKALREQDNTLQMVFVTAHPDYVFDGYGVGALGYLMKPPGPEQLADVVRRALLALHKHAEEVFYLHSSEGTYRVPKASVQYVYSDKRRVTYVTATRRYTVYGKLDDIAAEAGATFVRIHQRYLVNTEWVGRVNATEAQVAGETLPISRAYQKQAALALTRALLQ